MQAVESVLDLSPGEYAEWLGTQQISIGGSLIGALMGINPYSNPELVWESVLRLTAQQADNFHLRRGRVMEPVVVSEYEYVTRRVCVVHRKMYHPQIPYLHATPDRIIIGGEQGDEALVSAGVLETKCPTTNAFKNLCRDGIPASYYVQMQHYMNVLCLGWGGFAALYVERWTMAYGDVQRDDEVIAQMEAVVKDFWVNHILTRRRPSPYALPIKVKIPQLPLTTWTP